MPEKTDGSRQDSFRRWFGWYSIPVTMLLAWIGANLRHEFYFTVVDNILACMGILAGMVCIGWSRPVTRGLKWVLLALYPFAMFPIVGLIDMMVNGIGRLF